MNVIQVILLAGCVRPSRFRMAIDRPIASLPLDSRGTTLLDGWLTTLRELECPCDVLIASNTVDDAAWFERAIEHRQLPSNQTKHPLSLRVIRDPHDWRGSAGLLRDLRPSFNGDATTVLVIESTCMPPASLREPTARTNCSDAAMTIGATDDDAPAGVYALDTDVLECVPDVGYFDLKEQLVPRLVDDGRRIRVEHLADEALRIQSREAYLRAVQMWDEQHSGTELHERATVRNGEDFRGDFRGDFQGDVQSSEGRNRVIGTCVIEAGADVEQGVVLHDSIVLNGGRVASGAVVSRSVVTAGAVVETGSTTNCLVLTEPGSVASGSSFTPLNKRSRNGSTVTSP